MIRLDIKYRKKKKKKTINTNIWRINNTVLNTQQITDEIKEEIKTCIETIENRTTQNLWESVKTVLWEVYSNTSPPQEARET